MFLYLYMNFSLSIKTKIIFMQTINKFLHPYCLSNNLFIKAEASFPLTQATPGLFQCTTKLCWFREQCGRILSLQKQLLLHLAASWCISYFLWWKSKFSWVCGGQIGNKTSASGFNRKYILVVLAFLYNCSRWSSYIASWCWCAQ